MGLEKLKLIVFDLDYAIAKEAEVFNQRLRLSRTYFLPAYNHLISRLHTMAVLGGHPCFSPFHKDSKGDIIDLRGAKVKCYPEVPRVLKNLHEEGYILAVASRTSELKGATQLIELFGWDKYLIYKEIYPGSKVAHLNNIKKRSGLDFDQMMFLDDEHRNIRDVTKLGVVSMLVVKGVTKRIIEQSKEEFEKRR